MAICGEDLEAADDLAQRGGDGSDSNKHRRAAQSWGGGKRELKQVRQRSEARVR